MSKVISFLTILVAVLAAALFWTSNVASRQIHPPFPEELHAVFDSFDFDAAYQRLASVLRVKTVSRTAGKRGYWEVL